MTLAQRLRRLEAATGRGKRCPVCGARPGEELRLQIVEQVSGPRLCPGCGRVRWVRLVWSEQDDADDADVPEITEH